jgi:5-methylcytosine-specific restriction endonuclease McrA
MTPRPKGKWKVKALAQLCERDGAICQCCGTPQRFEWRSFGQWTSDSWGEWPRDPMWLGHYTSIRLCSFLEVEHRLPLADGGTNELDNLQLLCRDCHKKKTASEHSVRLKLRYDTVCAA